MEDIDSARAIKFGNEIIVEVQGTDEHGLIEVISYQFTSEDGEQELSPKEPVAKERVSIVRDSLAEDEFDWTPDRSSSA
jgi:hypothetical protein